MACGRKWPPGLIDRNRTSKREQERPLCEEPCCEQRMRDCDLEKLQLENLLPRLDLLFSFTAARGRPRRRTCEANSQKEARTTTARTYVFPAPQHSLPMTGSLLPTRRHRYMTNDAPVFSPVTPVRRKCTWVGNVSPPCANCRIRERSRGMND